MQDELPKLPLKPGPAAPEVDFATPAKAVAQAAKSVQVTADKWGQIPDAILSGHSAIMIGVGMFVGFVAMKLFSQRNP